MRTSAHHRQQHHKYPDYMDVLLLVLIAIAVLAMLGWWYVREPSSPYYDEYRVEDNTTIMPNTTLEPMDEGVGEDTEEGYFMNEETDEEITPEPAPNGRPAEQFGEPIETNNR